MEAYECGVRDFGENTLQGFEARRAWANAQGLNDIRWHFIGQIQSRKAKALWGQVSVIHTLDRVKLLKSVGEEQVQANRQLVQVNVGEEPQKGECCPLTCRKCSRLAQSLGRPQAALCAPPNDGKPEHWFQLLFQLAQDMNKSGYLPDNPQLSMGMSSDFVTAVRYGATLVRVRAPYLVRGRYHEVNVH